MNKNYFTMIAGFMITLLILFPPCTIGQDSKSLEKKYMTSLPKVPFDNRPLKYRMTAVYINRDIYGGFMGKTRVTGDYTRELPGDSVSWTNIYISSSDKYQASFPEGKRQDYMENLKYVPSGKVVEPGAFKVFNSTPDHVFARNLIWDMFSFELFAWRYDDSLKINKTYLVHDIGGQFEMGEIGTYLHNRIYLCWTGISVMNGVMCAVIDFTAPDNKVEISLPAVKTKGTEEYWGTIWISLKNKTIEKAIMYGGTAMEVEVPTLKDKILMKTVRDLEVTRIQ